MVVADVQILMTSVARLQSAKSSIDDLALFGGTPLFANPVHVGTPNIGNRAALFNRINDLLDRRRLTNNGPYVEELEWKIAKLLGVRHCIAVANGTLALQIAVRAAGLTGEVVVPSFTFVATAHALEWQYLKPIFCDINRYTHSLDVRMLEKRISPRTTGIIGVHVWGEPCDIEGLSELASQRHLQLLFDASHAFCCSHRGKMIGNFGVAEIFSFHATKVFNTFEGGAITTNDDLLANKSRLMRNFGFTDYDNVVSIGTNAKMTEVSAAMGLTGLESLDDFVLANQRNYHCYRKHLKPIQGVTLYPILEDEKRNYQYVVVEIDDCISRMTRNAVIRLLHAENVLARRYFYPGCHRMEPYRSKYPGIRATLPETELVCSRLIVLPTGTAINQTDVDAICTLLSFIVGNGSRIMTRLIEPQEAIQ